MTAWFIKELLARDHNDCFGNSSTLSQPDLHQYKIISNKNTYESRTEEVLSGI